MPDPTLLDTIETARADTFQSRVSQPVYGGGVFLVNWLATGAALVPPWWSPARDTALRNFWLTCDHLAGAIYTFESKMTAIPVHVEARDRSIQEHVEQAERETEKLYSASEFGEGWLTFYGKWVRDVVTTDNGGFAELIGPGDPAGPLEGAPVSIAHLDSSGCTRTGNSLYPVVYRDLDGRQYKLHYTRVLYYSQMASADAWMHGIGVSAVSRCINAAQNLVDIATFKGEKMGSRPHRKILITQGGLDPQDLRSAFELAEATMDNQGLTRYSKIVVAGSSTLERAAIEQVDLSSLPDGFDERTSTILGMAVIALALGVELNELFPDLGAGATRASALLQHMKQRGKGPGQILLATESLFNSKYLPPHLRLVSDYQDDAQDRQVADIRRVRAERRRIDAETGALDVRTMREQMLADGDIDRGQFERLELRDGRLANGASVLTLFYSPDRAIKPLLALGLDGADPLDVENNDQETMLARLRERLRRVNQIYAAARTDSARLTAYKAVCALSQLEQVYTIGDVSPFTTDVQESKPSQPGRLPISREQRRLNLTEPDLAAEAAPPESAELEPGYDEGMNM